MSNVIYEAMTKNVKALKKSRTVLRILLNKYLLMGKMEIVNSLTLQYALLYATYTEAVFLKLLHTPNSFPDESFIESVLFEGTYERSYEEKWNKCIDIGLSRILNDGIKGAVSNKKQRIKSIYTEYVINVRSIRNRIAHGQWVIALNSKMTDTNPGLSNDLMHIDYVKYDKYFDIYDSFSELVRMLLQSPFKGHYNNYYSSLIEIESFIENSKDWSINTRLPLLKRKNQNSRIVNNKK